MCVEHAVMVHDEGEGKEVVGVEGARDLFAGFDGALASRLHRLGTEKQKVRAPFKFVVAPNVAFLLLEAEVITYEDRYAARAWPGKCVLCDDRVFDRWAFREMLQ
jgi:hypothetical protein